MICVPIIARNNSEAYRKIDIAAPLAQMIEIRLDLMESFNLKELLNASPKPVLVTYRSKRDGGNGSVKYGTRIRYLIDAIELGADFVDVEYRLPLEFRQELFRHREGSQIIISTHLLNGTPSEKTLEEIFRKMAATGADIVKIVARARLWEDTLRVLELIPKAQRLGVKIIAFCIGPIGRITRVYSYLMGGYLAFASLAEGEESASGQIPVNEIKKLLNVLSL